MMMIMVILIITTYIQYISDKDCAKYLKNIICCILTTILSEKDFRYFILYYRTQVDSEKLIALFEITQLEKVGTRFQTSLV